MTRKSCAVEMRNEILRNYLNYLHNDIPEYKDLLWCALSLSKALFSCQLNICPNTLATMDMRVIPLHFPNSFSWLVRLYALRSSPQGPFLSPLLLNSPLRIFTVVSVSALGRSAVMLSVMLSIPGAQPLFISFSAVLFSFLIVISTMTMLSFSTFSLVHLSNNFRNWPI